MKRTLTGKLIVVFSGILIAVVLLNVAINSFLLSKVYLNIKIDSMEDLYSDLSMEYEKNGGSDAVEIVKESLKNNNLRVFIWNDEGKLIIDSFPLSDFDDEDFKEFKPEEVGEDERNRRWDFRRNEIFPPREFRFYPNETVVKEIDDYTLFYYSDRESDDRTYCLKGNLFENHKILIQMPVASIEEAVALFNTLLLIVGVLMLIVGITVVAITSKNIAKPVKELSEIAQSMQKLDFSKKCDYNRRDEIGSLGKSINSLSEKLEQTINELFEKNEKLKKDIELKTEIDNMRKEFIANASHELKTPIALIGGYAEGLKDNIVKDEDAKALYANVIIEEAGRMQGIIHQMLDLMEIEATETILDGMDFSLKDLVDDVINSFNRIITGNSISLDVICDEDVTVFGDYKRIYQAVSNFISNAINHLDENKIISITLENSKDKVKVKVFNTGNNIPEEDMGKIWDRFYKVDKAHTREYGGTGLGLAIVRSVVEMHGGEYGAENLTNGVEFYFTLKKENCNEN